MTKTVISITVLRLPSGEYRASLGSDDLSLARQGLTGIDEHELAAEAVRALPEFMRLPLPSAPADPIH